MCTCEIMSTTKSRGQGAHAVGETGQSQCKAHSAQHLLQDPLSEARPEGSRARSWRRGDAAV